MQSIDNTCGVPLPYSGTLGCSVFPQTFNQKSSGNLWPKLNEGEVYAFEYYRNKNRTQAQIDRRLAKDKRDAFVSRYAAFNEGTEKYEVSALKDWFGDDVKPKAEFTNDGKLVVSGLKIPIPDLASEYKKKYDARLEALKNEHKELVKSYCAPNKWALYGPVAIVSAVLLVAIGIIIYLLSRNTTPTPTPTPTQSNGWSLWNYVLIAFIVLVIIIFFVWFFFLRNKSWN